MKAVIVVLFACFSAFASAQNQVPSASELARVEQKLEILAKAFKEKTPQTLEPHLSPAFKVGDFDGEIARKVLAAAVAQVNDPRLEGAVITKTALGFSVALTSRDAASPRDIKLNGAFLFTEINLFSASVKRLDGLKGKLTQPEHAGARFELHHGLIVLKDVLLNGVPATFILDTGAPMMVLNSGAALTSGAAPLASGDAAQGINGAARLDVVALKSFAWQGFEMGAAEAVATDLRALEQRLGFTLHGLIGYELIKQYELVIDYAALRLELRRAPLASGAARLLHGRTPRVVVPFELRGHLPVVAATIGGLGGVGAATLRMALDTGAAANLLDSAVFARLAPDAYSNLKATRINGVGAGEGAQAQAFTLKSLSLNGQEFAQMNTASRSVAHLNAKPGAQPIDGILGYELLSKSLVAISYPERQLRFY